MNLCALAWIGAGVALRVTAADDELRVVHLARGATWTIAGKAARRCDVR